MPSTADLLPVEFQEITVRLREMLDDFEAAASTPVLNPQQISELLSALMRAGECLRCMPGLPPEGIGLTVSAYRTQVERLRALLPSIHGALLRERARLVEEQERLRGVSAWTQASQQSL